MAIAKFFIDQATISAGDSVTLSEQESHHAVKVRRIKQGAAVMLLNGKGLKALGLIEQCDRKALVVTIESVEEFPASPRRVDIAVALPKGDRQKQMLDMLAQLGVASITPLLCDFSISQHSEKLVQKWQRTLLEACKQSENPFLPKILEPKAPLAFAQGLNKTLSDSEGELYFAGIDGVLPSTLNVTDTLKHVAVMIGPEGGFSDKELSELQSENISQLRLSNYILRIETAAVAAAAAFI